jgi:membrane protease YdiL (CAAX protease family)
MTLLDHLLIVVLFLLLPLEGYFEFRGFKTAARAGDTRARSRLLIRTMAMEWTLTVALLAGWQSAGRAWTDLGLEVVGGWRAGVGIAAVALAACIVYMQHQSIARLSPERLDRLVKRTGDSLLMLPTNAAESRLFAAIALTAGICEEVLCRGFVFWYVGHWIGPWPTVVGAAIPFGIAHIYQGPKGAVRTAVIGVVIGSLYVATGSLLWPMIVHATIDLGAGMLGKLFNRPMPAPASPAPDVAVL